MQMIDTYEYRLQGRRPANYAALGFGMAMAHLGYLTDASALVWAAISAFLVLVLAMLTLNHAAGLRLGARFLEVYEGGARRLIALSSIESADLGSRRFGARHCVLRTSDGKQIALPQSALPAPQRLAQELRLRGVPTRILTTVTPTPQINLAGGLSDC